MLRSIARDVLPRRRISHTSHRTLTLLSYQHHTHILLRPTLIHTRFLSTPHPSSDPNHSEKPSDIPPSALQQRKQKVGLRPGPVKPPPSRSTPSTLSAHHVPKTASSPSHKLLPTSDTPPPLNEVKETAKRDIEEAEAHGILTPAPPNANWFQRTLHKAIQLAKFYFRGVKLIFVRRGEIASIRARIKAGGSPLTRSEFRFIQTQKDDVNKVIPFIIIALLLEEVIPIIAIYAPSFLPSTCILPSQQARIQEKKYQKAVGFAIKHSPLFSELRSKESPENYLPIDAIRHNNAPTVICGLLGLSTLGFDALRIHRIRRRLDFLAEDDRLLLQDKPDLSEKELTEALEERGLVGLSLSPKAKEAKLKWWLNSVQTSDPSSTSARRLALMVRNSAE
ncbi:hypothetical protein D9756_007385 [Leucocoprinus leucothites]|uniref:Letm1 RBD domain-containing protein n=1 Tax=Leucocoprinus leucothites TaxID=201217 RepID=A0A8H5D1R3_9AGAR|nr:hypothetical protein D9756_007385 [Leucoagaricus leucothites]